jgi:hypothetical protein
VQTDVYERQVSLGVVVRAYNPALKRLRQEDQKFEAILGYIARFCLKNQELGLEVRLKQ